MSDNLRDRIAAAIMREQVMNEKDRKFLRLSFTDEAKLLADAVIRELDSVLVDFGLWLAEEITGRQMARIDLESCLTDWKADDE